ncbi:MAG: S53 family peptidase, partial [Ktedonobacterales bacterium]
MMMKRARRPWHGWHGWHSVHGWRWALALCVLPLLAACAVTGNTTYGPNQPGTTPKTNPQGTETAPQMNNGATAYTPQQLRDAYGVTSLIQKGFTGKGETVVVIDSFGSPTLQHDFDVFNQQFGLPALTLDIRAPLGTAPFNPNSQQMQGWVGETSLDVEIIHAIAPDAKIVVLTSPVDETEGVAGLPQFLQLEQYAVQNHLGTVVSQSWGASEITLADAAGRSEIAQWDSFYHTATTQDGVTFFGGSGDSGATDYTDATIQHLSSTPTTSFPDDEPWVTAVGGTTLTQTGSNTYSESVWNSNGGASGGGFSRFYPIPSYQQSLPASVRSALNGRRGVPDVAACADPAAGLAIYFAGQWTTAGGTSAATPLWAGIAAIGDQMAGHSLGFINPALYTVAMSSQGAQAFHDITTGNNGVTNDKGSIQGYNAVPGWDPATGLG